MFSFLSLCSLGPHHTSTTLPRDSSRRDTMVSRRKILSRSRDDLNLDQAYLDEEEDVWYQKDKLFKVSNTYIIFDTMLSNLEINFVFFFSGQND